MRMILLAALSGAMLSAQPSGDMKFEVASIRPSQASDGTSAAIGLHLDGAQVRIVALPLRDYIARAYRLKVYQVSGPDWITSERYDLSGKLPAGSTSEQIPEMLQELLTERFGMKFHRQQKDLPVYALLLGKPPLKLKEAGPEDPESAPAKGDVNTAITGSAAGVSVNLGNGSGYTFVQGKFEFKKVGMDLVARQLERYVDRPIVDMTGLRGRYDLTFSVTPEDAQTMLIRVAVNAGVPLPAQALGLLDRGSIASLLDAFDGLGLKLDARKAPLDVLVVDQASKVPTEN